MSNLIDEDGNEIGHPEVFDMSIYEKAVKKANKKAMKSIKITNCVNCCGKLKFYTIIANREQMFQDSSNVKNVVL